MVGAVPPAGSLSIETTDANGEFDEHLGSTLAGTGTPAIGIYLFNGTLSGTGGVQDSDPMYFLFNNGADEVAFLDAQVFVRDTFAPGTNLVPEPSAIALLLVGIPITLRRRRA